MKQIDSSLVKDSTGESPNRILLDVLPEETFERRHIPGAINVCIYEIDFLEKIGKLIPKKGQEIIVYGESDSFEAAQLAYEKLQSNGWSEVAILKGGLENWLERGYPIEGKGYFEESLSGKFEASPEKSVVRWVGRNLINQHNGTIGLERATITLDQDRLVGGEAILDMTQMVCQDIEDPSMAQVLINHLRTDDFFLVDQFPTSRFEVSSADAIPDAHPGSPNITLRGLFTLRGQSHMIEFPATLGRSDKVLALQANFDFDRVRWHSKYGSGKIYEALGKHVVNDLISVSFQLITPID